MVWDPGSVKYDTSDADWKFVITYITKEQHERRFPKAELNEIDFASTTFENPAPNWIALGTNQDMVQLAEYWVREQTNPGSKNPKFEIWRYIINGMEILEEKRWIDDQLIPIVPTWGRQSFVDGMKRTFSLIRPVIDPQRMLNVYVSNLAELIGQMPKAMFTAPTDGIPANSMEDWKNSSYDPVLALLYRVYDQEGRTLPKPERIVNEPPIQAILMGIQQCIDAIKSGMGIFDASLGARSNETSGIAIQRRQKEADVTNFHFPDNQARTRKTIGEILVRCVPKVDGRETQLAIRTELGKTSLVPMGVQIKDPKTGQPVIHDLSQGEYGVSISTGPSVGSQREAAYDRDAALIQADPELIWVFGDQMFAKFVTILRVQKSGKSA